MLPTAEQKVFFEIPTAAAEERSLHCCRYRYTSEAGLILERARVTARDPLTTADWQPQEIKADITLQLYAAEEKAVFTLEWHHEQKALFVRGYPSARQHASAEDGNEDHIIHRQYFDPDDPEGVSCTLDAAGKSNFAHTYQPIMGTVPGPLPLVSEEQLAWLQAPLPEPAPADAERHTAGASGPPVPRWGIESIRTMWQAVMGSRVPLPEKPNVHGQFEGEQGQLTYRFDAKGNTECSFETLSRKLCTKAIDAIVKAWNARYPTEQERAGVSFVPTGTTVQIRAMVAEALMAAGYQLDTDRYPKSKLQYDSSSFIEDTPSLESHHASSSHAPTGGGLPDMLNNALGTGTGSSIAAGGGR